MDIPPEAQKKNSENENMPLASSHVDREILRRTRTGESAAGIAGKVSGVHQRTPLRLPETHLESAPRHCAHDILMSQTVFALTEQALRAMKEMTPREVRVARQVALGRRNREIGDELHLSEKIIKNILYHLYGRLYEKMGLYEPNNMRVTLAVYMMHLDPSLLPEPGEWLKHLTPQASRTVSLMARGMSNQQIADEMGLSEKTVKNELTEAFRRAKVRSREELAGLVWASIHHKTPLRLPEVPGGSPGFVDRFEQRRKERGISVP